MDTAEPVEVTGTDNPEAEPSGEVDNWAGADHHAPGTVGGAQRPASRRRVERSKDKIVGQLTLAARAALERSGLAELSLRSVARDMGLGTSGVYRYISNRDHLVRLLINEVTAEIGAVADAADHDVAREGGDPADRWLAVARAVRDWARAHPHLMGLLLTAGPDRPAEHPDHRPIVGLWRSLSQIIEAGRTTGALQPPAVSYDVDGIFDVTRYPSGELPRPPFTDLAVRAVSLYTSLIGAVTADLFGHFDYLDGARDRLFDLLVAIGAAGAGLDVPVTRESALEPSS